MNEKPIFIYGSSNDDKKAIKEILNAKIEVNSFHLMDENEKTPIIHYKSKDFEGILSSMDFYGIEGTRTFIKRWKKENG